MLVLFSHVRCICYIYSSSFSRSRLIAVICLIGLCAAGPNVSDVCPQLRGQAQCCSADYFRNAENRLRGQTLLSGFSKQGQSRLDLFNGVAEGIVECK